MISRSLRQTCNSQLSRFLITGGWNTIFSYISLALMYYFFSNRIHYLVIMVLATIINITNAFICHKFFVFKTKGNYLREYLRYYVVYSVPIGISLISFPFCIEILKINFYVTQALLTLITVIISYFGHKHVSFKKQ
ncbi:MAG TPA: GtrA family protein [Thermodesulfovibrionales bacterium]|nr:GtrA family protein [Thermodesulfovibrionales bacterium]